MVFGVIPATFLLYLCTVAQSGKSTKPLLEEYCIDCHDGDVTRGGLNLAAIMTDALDAHPEIWEKVILRLQSRQMPPLVPLLMTAKPQPTVEASPPIRSWGTRR